ncbi:MAG: flagellar hook-length control protein FliK [Candidatus Lambdaproteobacteria bacterium]|nr:flagellar hook-length control protein FliK [Candidatus Lambdaproteobacteria bacterium]
MAADPRARGVYGEEAAQAAADEQRPGAADAEQEQRSEPAGEEIDQANAAEPQPTPHAKPGDPQQVALTAAALPPPQTPPPADGPALAPADPPAEQPQAQRLPSAAAQIGAQAYRASPHGKDEAQFARAAGAIPPAGSEGPAAKPGQVAEVKDAALMPVAGKGEGGAKPLSAIEALNLARKPASLAKDAEGKQAAAELTDTSAQARNQVLLRLGHAADPAAQLAQRMAVAAQLQQGGGKSEPAAAQEQAGKGEARPTGEPQPASGLTAPAAATVDHTAGAKAPARAPDPQMLERIVQESRWLLRDPRNNEVTFKLHPEQLGSMKLKVVQEDGALRLEMTVNNAHAKSLVESQLNDLRDRLVAENLVTGEFMVQVDVQRGNDSPHYQDGPQPANPFRAAVGVDSAVAIAAAQRNRPVWGRNGIGVYA